MSQDVKLDDLRVLSKELEMDAKVYSESSSTATPLLARPEGAKVFTSRVFDSFRSGPSRTFASATTSGDGRRVYDIQTAVYNTAHTPLTRTLKGRHLQMIAIGGSIGAGLFIGTGQALQQGGPASLLLAFIIIGGVLFFTVQALGEMAVTFPVAGSFSAFGTRFMDPAWGFSSGWNYAAQWLFVMPLEIMAAAITLEFWDTGIPGWASITMFLGLILAINLSPVKIYGEAEYIFSIMKVTAIIGFIILGVVINCGGGPDSGYIGGRYWSNPGAFNDGFKGFCNILVTAAFSFAGTELIGLAAAETHNPSKSLPTAIKQVFWRIAIFYVVSVGVIGLLVPYTSPQLISRNDVDSKASPFIIAIKNAGISGLDSVMNAIVMIAVLSVANSSMYGATRTLAALAEQGQAPRILAYYDRKGRPLVAIGIAGGIGLFSYLYITPIRGPAFTWLLALSGLSSIFTWISICYSHIQFRRAWLLQGNLLTDLIYRSPTGVAGSWVGLISLFLILAAQFWVALSPSGSSGDESTAHRFANFFEAFLAMPIVVVCYLGYKFWYRTKWVQVRDIDLKTGRNEFESELIRQRWREDRSEWPRWKKIYNNLC